MELLVGGPIVQDIAASFDDYWNDEWSFPIEMLSHLSPSYAALDDAATVKEPDLRIHNEPTADLLQRRWQALVRGALPGTPTLYVDAPPVGNPVDTPPIELANALIDLFDKAEEEVLILSAYLIPSPRLEGAVARAVARAVEDAEPGETVLLAPAAASFDQYDNFEKRGEDFIARVEAMV